MLCVTLFAVPVARAQEKKTFLSIGPDITTPVGDYSNFYSVGVGASATLERVFSDHWHGTLTVGFTNIFGKDAESLGYAAGRQIGSVKKLPVRAGVRYFFGSSFYASGDAGIVIPMQEQSVSRFMYSPGIGYIIKDKFDIGVRYEQWVYPKSINLNQIGLRLAYRFPLK